MTTPSLPSLISSLISSHLQSRCPLPPIPTFPLLSSLPWRPNKSRNLPLPLVSPDWHIHLIKRILHNIIRIQFVNLPHYNIDVRLVRFRKQEKFGPREGLKTCEAKEGTFEDFEASVGGSGGAAGGRGKESGGG